MLCPAFRLRYRFTHLCSCLVSRPAVLGNQNGMLAGHAVKCPVYSAFRMGIRPVLQKFRTGSKKAAETIIPWGLIPASERNQWTILVWNRSGSPFRNKRGPVRNVFQHIFLSLAAPCAISWRFSPAPCHGSICKLYIFWAKYRAKALCNQGKRSLPLSIRANVPATCLPELQQL